MHDAVLKSGWDTVLVAIPFVVLLLVGFFRLDDLFASAKHKKDRRRPECGFDENGELLATDPDGRPWSGEQGPR